MVHFTIRHLTPQSNQRFHERSTERPNTSDLSAVQFPIMVPLLSYQHVPQSRLTFQYPTCRGEPCHRSSPNPLLSTVRPRLCVLVHLRDRDSLSIIQILGIPNHSMLHLNAYHNRYIAVPLLHIRGVPVLCRTSFSRHIESEQSQFIRILYQQFGEHSQSKTN